MPIDRSSPYFDVPPTGWWRSAMGNQPPEAINPHHAPSFRIESTDRIASAGSCFAQRISEMLRSKGYNYFITEPGPPLLDRVAAAERGFGIYSARYGNLYTVMQLLQLFQRAYDLFEPVEPLWRKGDGRFVDPFRSGIEPRGFESESACLWDRRSHLRATRRVFEEMDVFIFTLGLTEAWESAEDGAVFPNAPGSVHGGSYTPDRHRFCNFNVNEVIAQLDQFLDLLSEVNAQARVILTVSPVPLIATFEPRHVLQSTVYSKSVLRVACEEIVRRRDNVVYFGSYEIVTATGDSGRYFHEDRRGVSDDAVAHVMDCFAQQFLGGAIRELPTPAPMASKPTFSGPMCDEDEILKAMAEQSRHV